MKVLGLDVSKLSVTYWILEEVPSDPKAYARLHREQKLDVSAEGRKKLLELEFDFAVLEPTGIYSRIWRHWLKESGRPYRLVGHQELKSYREGWRLSNKTDKLDGLAMSMYGLERFDYPSSWLIERDTTLSDLVLLHSHLNTQKNGLQNNLRQKLAFQLPEWHDRQIKRGWAGSVPGILKAIAGEPKPRWKTEIDQSCGMGLAESAEILARLLISHEEEEILVEKRIDEELAKSKYARYIRAFEKSGIPGKIIRPALISAIYPFEQFLDDDGKRRISHSLSKANGKRVRKDESLRSFKLSCGLGLIWTQSGEWEGWTAGGSGSLRKALRMAVLAAYLTNKKAIKDGKSGKPEMETVKTRHDNQGMLRVARKWIEKFYTELVNEFCA